MARTTLKNFPHTTQLQHPATKKVLQLIPSNRRSTKRLEKLKKIDPVIKMLPNLSIWNTISSILPTWPGIWATISNSTIATVSYFIFRSMERRHRVAQRLLQAPIRRRRRNEIVDRRTEVFWNRWDRRRNEEFGRRGVVRRWRRLIYYWGGGMVRGIIGLEGDEVEERVSWIMGC